MLTRTLLLLTFIAWPLININAHAKTDVFTHIAPLSISQLSIASLSISQLPEPVSNNAVTYIEKDNEKFLLSFSGLGKNKQHTDVHNKSFIYRFNTKQWTQIKDVPIAKPVLDKSASNASTYLTGRLASIATSIGNLAYVFGGYTVAGDHHEVSVPDVYSYNVSNDTYTPLAPMPVPVDDSIALPYNNRYIYLVSGWHNDGNVNLVQIYDTQTNKWSQATPYPGSPVFGHAGGIIDNTLLVCDGVKVQFYQQKRRDFVAEPACYLGTISNKNINKIDWRIVKHPTGTARYRMAAIGSKKLNKFVFIGGSENPYNYDGIGYNGKPSQPTSAMWLFDLSTKQWALSTTQHASMDHRGLIEINNQFITLGGMAEKQHVLNKVLVHQYTTDIKNE